MQTRPYQWMYKPTPQTEWIRRQGMLLWLAFFFLELGAGTFIVGSAFNNLQAMFTGWLITAIGGGGCHLLYLGHPLRAWRVLFSSGWKTSWISRGLIFTTVFLLLGGIHLILAQWATSSIALLVIADIFAFFAVIYVGFAMSYVSAIPLWNTALLPVLYAILGIWGGLGITLMTMANDASAAVETVEAWSRIFLVAFIFIVFIYFFTVRYQGAVAPSSAGKTAVREIMAGKWAPLFWVLVVVLAMALPLGLALSTWMASLAIPIALLYIAIIFELLGDLALRYVILRNGLYTPLLPL
ncbi:MAG: polysulfide reductase NrfD [Chloroflexi bacterium]|nr:polysulfide reductase NrfD [Chloroflexota bacterium]